MKLLSHINNSGKICREKTYFYICLILLVTPNKVLLVTTS